MVFILSVIIIVLDQLSKSLAIKYLKFSDSKIIVPDFFRLTYVENYGAAFGVLQNKRWIFIVITLAVIIYISFFMFKNYYKVSTFMRIGVAMFIGGALGNFIDRVRYGYVVDFLSFRLFNRFEFPVFNVADIFIVVSTIILVTLILFDKYEA